MKEVPTNKPLPLESTSTSPPQFEFARARQFIADIVTFDDTEYIEKQTDLYLAEIAKEDANLLAELLFELACSEEPSFNLIAADNVGVLYGANPDLGRPLWELMVETEGTHSDAAELLSVSMDPTNGPLSQRQIQDYAAIRRRADEYEQSRLQQQQ